MKIEVKSIEPRDEMGKVFVKVSFWDKKGPLTTALNWRCL
jgi:hypothetical protein